MERSSPMTFGCPGCGVRLPGRHLQSVDGYHASAECFRKYGELSSYTLGKQDIRFIHQHAVDAYAAQHVGGKMKNITAAFALIGLYYAVEHGYDGKQVQRVHTLLGRQKLKWPELAPPEKSGALTVCDVLNEAPGERRDELLHHWMREVWESWRHRREWVRSICRTYLA